MPELRPFKGIRYSSQGEISRLVCPPYDVISPVEQQRLHELHPNNAARLELAEPRATENKYAHVGETFKAWCEDGVLQRDAEESLYVYRQDFEFEGTRRRVMGIIGALDLEEFGTDSGVLPHERTMPGPKKDRLALMRACPANISPIFAIYRGKGGLRPFLDSLEEREPEARFEDEAGILHRLWVITAPAETAIVADAVRPGPLVIADGHHRYETALAYHREQRDTLGDHGTIMCFCVDADSEELAVLPYNRVLKTSLAPAELGDRLSERFSATPITDDPSAAVTRSDLDHPFVAILPDSRLLFSVSDEEVVLKTGARHPAWQRLDVVALHEVVLPELTGDAIEEMVFTKDSAEIRERVASGWSIGFILKALDAPQVVDVATSGERMPQKASYFWPKAVTGLVFHPLD